MSPASYQTAPPRGEAGNGTRTRDPNLGKVVLYQLSYSRTLVPPQAYQARQRFAKLQGS